MGAQHINLVVNSLFLKISQPLWWAWSLLTYVTPVKVNRRLSTPQSSIWLWILEYFIDITAILTSWVVDKIDLDLKKKIEYFMTTLELVNLLCCVAHQLVVKCISIISQPALMSAAPWHSSIGTTWIVTKNSSIVVLINWMWNVYNRIISQPALMSAKVHFSSITKLCLW